MRDAVKFFEEQKFYLPKFAFWLLDDWKSKGEEIKEIINNQLGWDITDFGKADFSKFGLILFTVRNGNLQDTTPNAKDYCEKIMIAEEGQMTPMHHHYQKTEDIINRGGGILIIQLYNATDDDQLADTKVKISVDGAYTVIEAGSTLELSPGDSLTLTPKHFHKFWAKEGKGKVLVGEISKINDDRTDNKFLEEIGRFPDITEDEEPLYLLYDDYKKFLDL
jgi:D-lyxose ketol-isomerase